MLPALFAVICMLGLCGNGLVIFCTIFLTKYRTCTGNESRKFAGDIDLGDECWRQNVLVTSLRCC